MKLNKKKVQIVMIRNDLTIKGVAEKYGCSPQFIREVMNRESVTINTLNRLTAALGVDVTEIIDL